MRTDEAAAYGEAECCKLESDLIPDIRYEGRINRQRGLSTAAITTVWYEAGEEARKVQILHQFYSVFT